jgi:hypothetical protein
MCSDEPFDEPLRDKSEYHRPHYSLSVASLIVYSAQIYEVDLIGENAPSCNKPIPVPCFTVQW